MKLQNATALVTGGSRGIGAAAYTLLRKTGHKVVGHWGGVKGYRSLIMFDPDAKTGIVALWNGSSEKPHGMEFELMDMVYGLPFVDWMQIDHGASGAAEEASEPA